MATETQNTAATHEHVVQRGTYEQLSGDRDRARCAKCRRPISRRLCAGVETDWAVTS